MSSISINKIKINSFNENEIIEEFIENYLSSNFSNEHVVTDCFFNGKAIDMYHEAKVFREEIGKFDELDFTVKSSLELALEALENCPIYIDYSIGKISELCKLLQNGNSDESNALFSEVIDTIDMFIQLITGIHKTFKRNMANISEQVPILQKLEIHLFGIVKALLPAKEKDDIIMLCDLLEYELVDNLTQWKINAIPALKKIRNL